MTLRDASLPRGTLVALSVVLACALVWTLVPSLVLSAPHGDNVEQLNWSHALQWGYFKHPPLPTWLLHGAIDVFGASAELTYALAMACVALALLLVWLCARELMDPQRALIALLLSSANYYLMGRGSFLNHNTVMLPFVALSAWAVLRIVRGAGAGMWVLLGLAQALGLLTKYQMALIVLANGAALLAAGVHRQPRFGRHLALAAAATGLPLIPHVQWLGAHQFSTFEYAGHSLLAGLGPLQRLAAVGGFLAQQLARLAPALLALGLTLAVGVVRRKTPPAVSDRATAPAGAASKRVLAILALTPMAAIVLLVLAAGVAPQNHWGSTTTLLIPLLLVSRLRPEAARSLAVAAAATAACHAGAVAWNVTVWRIDPGPHHRFAAKALAALAQQYWTRHQDGPIRLLVGPDWEAGSVALYLPGHPAVLPDADARQAPWVDPGLISRCGALVIARSGEPLERLLTPLPSAKASDQTLLEARDSLGRPSTVQAAVIAPTPGLECR